MSKYTQGPWEIGDECATAIQIRPAGKNRGVSLALAVDRPAAQGMHGDPITRDEALANASLIAAAPELLEACQTSAEWLRREDAGFPAETRFNTPDGEAKWREWWDENMRICNLAQEQARAAIAKARGDA